MTETKPIADYRAELGEGPAYDPATGTLYWFDIVESKLLEKRMPDGELVVHDLPFMASALAVIDPARQLLVTEHGLYVREKATGKLTLHVGVEDNNEITRSNDARVHPGGSLWFSTMAKDERSGAGAIYWYRHGEVRLLFPSITIPNSICFAPDGSCAYFTDTQTNMLKRVTCDPLTGLPTGEPQLFYAHRGDGGLDGSVMDADGILWNARWGGSCVDAYAPDGTLVRTVPVPARQPSCPVFIGKNAQHMAVTSAWKGLGEAEKAADPEAGRTFLLNVEVNGRFDPPVAF
ncbi:MAG: SMP-30/gluconolactonase/LRE family protein [Rhizobiaceae bacterium]|nr:SMP-30/gluconolactonase/LRE family protein [Rhizobiaceae bacterium]